MIKRVFVLAMLISASVASVAAAQSAQCTVSGFLFNPDSSPASSASVKAIQVERNGTASILTPILMTSDVMGAVTFSVPQGAIVWVAATAIGLAGSGDVGVLIPNSSSADLNVLAQSAKPPVSGFNLSSGANPTLALSLEDFGINLTAGAVPTPTVVESFNGRTGAVGLTSGDISTALSFTPLDPGTVIGAVNASTASIDSARLSANVVRRDLANVFSAQQTFSSGVLVSTGTSSLTATTDTDIVRFYRYNPSHLVGWELGGVINSQGGYFTNAWVTISGTGNKFTPPSPDPYMLGIVSDVPGPSIQVRSSTAGGAYLFSGLDQQGRYNISIEPSGELRWGASTRVGMDANLYRIGPGSLKTDGSLTVANSLVVGSPDTSLYRTASANLKTDAAFTVGSSLFLGGPDVRLYRAGAANLRTDASLTIGSALFVGGPDAMLYRVGPAVLGTNAAMSVDGGVGVGTSDIAYPFSVRGSTGPSWKKAAHFEAGNNAEGSGAVVDFGPQGVQFGAKLYGGRWSSTDRGSRLVGVNSIGQENAWLHLNGENSSAALNTRGIDRLIVNASGNIGINTNPSAGAILDVNGGDTRGLRIAPRSLAGPPTTGTWSLGTMVVDSTGVVYVSVASGSPGTWKSLNPTAVAPVAPAITGTRFLCVSTLGVVASSATACSGT